MADVRLKHRWGKDTFEPNSWTLSEVGDPTSSLGWAYIRRLPGQRDYLLLLWDPVNGGWEESLTSPNLKTLKSIGRIVAAQRMANG